MINIKNLDTIIVGNSSVLLDEHFGNEIDKYNTVVRINDFVINGFENYVGSKTNFWFTNNSKNLIYENKNLYNYPCYVFGNIENKNIKKINFISDKMIETLKEISKLKYSSVEFMAILYFIYILNKNVTIVGVDFFQNSNYNYYNDYCITGSSQINLMEKKFIDNLIINKKVIKLDSNKNISEVTIKKINKRKVLIIGNELPNINFINSWNGEIWLCNGLFINKVPKINRIGCVNKDATLSILNDAEKYNFLIFTCFNDINNKRVYLFKNYGGHTTAIELLRQALLEGYREIIMGGFYYSGNFKSQYDQLLKNFEDKKDWIKIL